VRQPPTRSPFLTLVALCALATSCGRGSSENLIAGKPATRAQGVANPALLTDGQLAAEGADWNAPAATVFQSESAFVEYDLGKVARIESAYVQGDNNDDYIVSVSDDGASYRELWVARSVGVPGLRGRSTDGLGARGRWLRLAPRGGDHVYSVTELQVWTGALPALASAPSSEVLAARVRAHFLYLVLAFGIVLFATRQGSRPGRVLLLWLLPAIAAALVVRALAASWPAGAREVSAARASAAAIALLALLRGWDRLRTEPPHRKTVVAACATGALLAFACFYNLGRPQFWHNGKQRPMFVHVADMRIYQPFAKYFDELHYDGVYLASALAFAEDERGGSIDSIASSRIRDLRDFRMRPIGDLRDDMVKVKQRFTPERWAEFKRDMVFFRAAAGSSFINTLDDHGANAPPAWVGVARVPLGHVTATETTLTITGLLDAALLLALALVLARTFGLLPALIAMTVFGATDLYQFGTNWAGATLRHDWLVLLGFAACALRKQRWLLGGALLGFATMLRLVPAVAMLGVAAPTVGWLVARWFRRQAPGPREIMAENREALRVGAGAVGAMLAIFLVTGLLYSFGAWGEWWVRIRALNSDLGTNEVDLRMLIAGVDSTTNALIRDRWPLFVLAPLAGAVTVVLASRGRPLEEAMLLGLPLALVLMNPVNYHDHFVFLLPLLGARRGLLGISAPLLVLCVAGYWLDLDPDWVRHFEVLTAALFAAMVWLYLAVMRGPAPATPAPPDGRDLS